MKKDDYCSGCGQKDTCRQAYEKMGNVDSPNVTVGVLVAFLVPIAVFIGSLAGFQQLFEGWLEEKTSTLLGFLAALSVTFVTILVIRFIRNKK